MNWSELKKELDYRIACYLQNHCPSLTGASLRLVPDNPISQVENLHYLLPPVTRSLSAEGRPNLRQMSLKAIATERDKTGYSISTHLLRGLLAKGYKLQISLPNQQKQQPCLSYKFM